jgi:hypothetical protein
MSLAPKKMTRRPFEGSCIRKDFRRPYWGALVLDQNDKRAILRGPESRGSMRRPFREGPVR